MNWVVGLGRYIISLFVELGWPDIVGFPPVGIAVIFVPGVYAMRCDCAPLSPTFNCPPMR